MSLRLRGQVVALDEDVVSALGAQEAVSSAPVPFLALLMHRVREGVPGSAGQGSEEHYCAVDLRVVGPPAQGALCGHLLLAGVRQASGRGAGPYACGALGSAQHGQDLVGLRFRRRWRCHCCGHGTVARPQRQRGFQGVVLVASIVDCRPWW